MKKLLITLLVFLSVSSNIFAYNDINERHWAYSSVKKYADSGILVGDSSGNYSPNKILDRFEVTRALAKTIGYKDPLIDINISEDS